MHRCLTILEIVEMILEHLCGSKRLEFEQATWKQPWLTDVAITARVCRFFNGPAITCLWRSAVLVNLIRCMPSDLLDFHELDEPREGHDSRRISTDVKYEMWLDRPIRATDWDRVSIYAFRVKELFSGCDEWDISEVLPTIAMCFPNNILGNLKSLHWACSNEDFPHITMLLIPTITSISFSSSPAALSLLSVLTMKCPTLKGFHLSLSLDTDDWDSEPEIEAVSAFVLSLYSIESLSVPIMDQSALEHIRTVPNLKSLRIDTFLPELTLPPVRDTETFRALDTLQICYAPIGPTTQFLGMFCRVPLTSVSIDCSPSPTGDETHMFLTAMSAGLLHASLTQLTFGRDGEAWPDPSIHRIQRSSILLLLPFINLTILDISSSRGLALDNALISDMTRAWPLIEILHLSARYASPLPQLTLNCLHSFARHSSRLRTLTISLDATVVPPASQTATQQHALLDFDVEDSAITTPIAVARFLSHIFPALGKISTRRPLLENVNADEDGFVDLDAAIGFRECWNQVQALLSESP
ncbi:hypothetical protein B0H19DRAFT_1073847 [Mycena capillaripes]|nr:hypothetical protein B0H19DRAFT_1073847 [Mycena capillaripes]